jgi:hypothetical protein
MGLYLQNHGSHRYGYNNELNKIRTLYLWISTRVAEGPCHHNMAHPGVADGGDGLQMWRVAANILNKYIK